MLFWRLSSPLRHPIESLQRVDYDRHMPRVVTMTLDTNTSADTYRPAVGDRLRSRFSDFRSITGSQRGCAGCV